MAKRSKPLPGYRRLPGHRYENTRSGKVITEYRYRSLKARRSGFKNYTEQRRFRQSQDFAKLRFDILSHNPDADLSSGGEIEREIGELIRHRRKVGGGQPGSGQMIGEPGEKFDRLLARLGLEPWWKWRFWYSEIGVSA